MRPDDASNHVQLSGGKTMTASKPERLKPELAGLVLTLDVHMWRLTAVETCKEEPIWTRDARDLWHSDESLEGNTIPHPTRTASTDQPNNNSAGQPIGAPRAGGRG